MSNSIDKILKQYHKNLPVYIALKDDIEDILERIIQSHHFRISNYAIRIKKEQALIKKISYKNKYNDINDLTDIVACRIITLFEDDVDRIFACLKENFEIVEYNDKRKRNNEDCIDFGYNSLHLLVKFTDERCQLIEYADYKDMVFEIQIRTTLQHSWAEIEHGLGYKSQYEIPKSIRRRLTRLSAAIELLDEEFVSIAKEVDEYNKGLEHIEKVLKTDINVNSLIQYVNTSPRINELFENVHQDIHFEFERDAQLISHSRLIQRFRFLGYMYIHELDDFVEKHFKEAEWVFRDYVETHNDHKINIYNILLCISVLMLSTEGRNDPENILSKEMIARILEIKEKVK